MASADGGPTVLDETCEVRFVAAVAEMGLGEGDMSELTVFGLLGEIQGRPPERTGEV